MTITCFCQANNDAPREERIAFESSINASFDRGIKYLDTYKEEGFRGKHIASLLYMALFEKKRSGFKQIKPSILLNNDYFNKHPFIRILNKDIKLDGLGLVRFKDKTL